MRPSGHVVLAASRGKRLRLPPNNNPRKKVTLNVRTRRHSPGSRAYRDLRLETRGGTRIQGCLAPYCLCCVIHVTRPPSNSQSSPGTYVGSLGSTRLSIRTVYRPRPLGLWGYTHFLLFVGSIFRQPSSLPTTNCAWLAYPPVTQPTFYTMCRRSWRYIGAGPRQSLRRVLPLSAVS